MGERAARFWDAVDLFDAQPTPRPLRFLDRLRYARWSDRTRARIDGAIRGLLAAVVVVDVARGAWINAIPLAVVFLVTRSRSAPTP